MDRRASGVSLPGLRSFFLAKSTLFYYYRTNKIPFIDFLIVAFVLFLVLKAFNAVFNKKKEEAEEAPAEPTTKVCPYCQSEISIKAVRCPQCTSKLEGFPEIND